LETITVFKVYFKPKRDIVVPPFTSKLSRTIIIKALEKQGFNEVVSEIKAPWKTKPYVFTVVFQNNKPLFKTAKSPPKPLVLKANEEYFFKITTIGSQRSLRIVQAISNTPEISVYNSEVLLVGVEARTVDFGSLKVKPNYDYVKLEFITPTLLQLPKPKRIKEKIKLRHILFPLPMLITYSLAKHWNLHAPHQEKISNIEKLAIISNYILQEVNNKLKPVTAIYDEKRRPRGITGWTIYKINNINKKHTETILKLLNYANYIGIGRSRTIGFGTTKTTHIQPSANPISADDPRVPADM